MDNEGYMNHSEVTAIADTHLGCAGKMLSGSKSAYREKYPNHLVVFNSNICTKEYGKIWFGDIDVALDEDKLEKLADELKVSLYVLYEMDGRFEYETNPQFNKAVHIAGVKYGHV
jgi:diphthamide synthase (EF-2-diphthine--ammonia ligase)